MQEDQDQHPLRACVRLRLAARVFMRPLIPFALVLSCLYVPAAAAAQELGRLFFTAQQRQDLERRRASNRVEEKAKPIREGQITLEGHVQRSSGRTATWINGAPRYDDSPAGRDPARVSVIPDAGQPGVSLKVGQTYERASGEVRDALTGGKITVGKSARPLTGADAAKAPAPGR